MLQLKKSDGTVFNLDGAKISIGRDSENDIILKEPSVSGFHANIFIENDDAFFIDLGSTNGSYLNGKKVSKKVKLNAWDKLKLADVDFEIIDTELRRPTSVINSMDINATANIPSSESATVTTPTVKDDYKTSISIPNAFLVKISGDGPDKVKLSHTLTVGRQPGNDLLLNIPTVSSKHAKIEYDGTNFRLIDLGSTNGTFVNDLKIDRVLLKNGDIVRFDEVTYRFEIFDVANEKTDFKQNIQNTNEENNNNNHNQDEEENTFNVNKSGLNFGASGFDIKWLLFSFKGRLNRMSYFATTVLLMLISALISFIIATSLSANLSLLINSGIEIRDIIPMFGTWGIIYFILCLIISYINLSIMVKRLHDMNFSGYVLLIYFFINVILSIIGSMVPVFVAITVLITFLFFLFLIFWPGTEGPNRFGNPQ
jgi:pSer/pThr/pTyr-binding forkhead associated (FHA) protein/uncharacterized membrane protein YhaH (DUF805 family)